MKRYLGADLHRTQFTVCTRLERGEDVSAAVADAPIEAICRAAEEGRRGGRGIDRKHTAVL